MILSNLIPDRSLVANQGGAPAGNAQHHAEEQFKDVLASVPDAPTVSAGKSMSNDDPAKTSGAGGFPSSGATTLAASSFLAAMSNARTSSASASAGQAVTATTAAEKVATASLNLPVSAAPTTGAVSSLAGSPPATVAGPVLQPRLEGPPTSGFAGFSTAIFEGLGCMAIGS